MTHIQRMEHLEMALMWTRAAIRAYNLGDTASVAHHKSAAQWHLNELKEGN